ncbi:MAG: PEGA domain-containing protein [Candidatus Portnoybacteria bacterium]|nr:PEGA domain-containing protein [Candidatus Portnoybacteria bacterium]
MLLTMTLRIRRLIFWGLVIIFLIITPLIIAYGLGYSFDWQKKTFAKTGSFYFESSPTGGKIYIDGNNKGKTNKYIRRMLPKEYNIHIEKNGFYAWDKRLKIESGIVTEARNILLVPQNPKIETVQENIPSDFLLPFFTLTDAEKQKIKQASATAKAILKNAANQPINESIFYLEAADRILYKSDLNGTKKQQISRESLPAGAYKIIASPNENSVAALDKTGQLFLLNPDRKIFEKAADNIKNAQFSPDNKKLLYYSGTEIMVLFLDKILIQPHKERGQKETLTRFSENIDSAIWYPEDNEHIIFIVGDTIKIIELDDRGKRNMYDLVKMRNFTASTWENPQITYDSKRRKLYFISDTALYSLQIKTGQLW